MNWKWIRGDEGSMPQGATQQGFADAAEGPASAPGGLTALLATLLKRLRRSADWRVDMPDVLRAIAEELDCHRAILFRLLETPDQGFLQRVETIWIDGRFSDPDVLPKPMLQETVVNDPFLRQVATDGRKAAVFTGNTREIPGHLHAELTRQNVKSFISLPVFAHGHLWGSLAINDCAREREWTPDEIAATEILVMSIGNAIDRAESDAHVSEVIRAAMVQGSLDAVVVLDEVGNIIEFNPAAEKMYGWKKEEVLGKDVLHTLIPPFYRGDYSNGGDYLNGRGSPMVGRRLETISTHKSGEIFPIELTGSQVQVADRRIYIGSIRDLRPARAAEDEINSQREKLHQNEKMAAMGSLLAGVSHELNNPLAVVVAQSTLLHEFAPDAATKARAEKVRAAAERCGRIVKSFLGMVRLHPPAQVETDLNAVVRAALEVTAYGARSSGIAITTDLSPAPLPVLGDADHLTQVVANFLVNSQHALAGRPPGSRRITVRTFRTEGGEFGFSVEDNGPGVPEPIRERIFESYFTTKPVGVGTGIGLSISRSIVERHRGKLRFEPVEPNGARFVVELPAMQGAETAQTVGQTASQGLRHALIIDDEPDVAGALADILELMGLKSRIVSAWTSADAMLDGFHTDIVFSDLRMPGIDGAAIYRALLDKRPDFARRFVLVTGDMLGARAEVEALPAHLRPQVLEKPFSTLDVRGVLAAIGEQVLAAKAV